MPDDLATLAQEVEDEMFGRKPKPPPAKPIEAPPKLPEPPPYWKLVESWRSGEYPRRETFEHALSNGGVLVMVRCADAQTESCSICYVPPLPSPPAPYRTDPMGGPG